jgi:hypothetical protein
MQVVELFRARAPTVSPGLQQSGLQLACLSFKGVDVFQSGCKESVGGCGDFEGGDSTGDALVE